MSVNSILAFVSLAVASTALGADIPLPEHPRPDWERADWVNLNGVWDFRFDGESNYARRITVPFGWGSPLSGVKDEGDTGWYRREIAVPESWKGRRVFVVVGAADHDTECRFDGARLGTHVGGYTPFEFELTDYVKWGQAQALEFKIWDPPASVAKGGHYLYGKQGYGNARGIWQTVYLEARGDVYLDRVAFVPSLKDRTVALTAFLSAPAKTKMTLKAEFDGWIHELAIRPGQQSVSKSVALEKPRLWTLDDPYLYDVDLALIAHPTPLVPADEVKTYFGYRSVGVGKTPNGDSCVTLNGEPIYLQLTLDQSYHPEGWYTFPSDEFMKNEIMISKRLALSGNRVHIKVEVPRKLYWADKLGLLIQADVPCAWGEASEAMFEEHWKCFEEMVRRDFNHPSIYQWTLFNETWGLQTRRPGTKTGLCYREETQRKVAAAYALAKALDPTRLVEDHSVCQYDHVATDVNSWHCYRPGYMWEECLTNELAHTAPGSTWNFIGGHVQGDQPMMNSECGNVWGYTGSTGDCDLSWDYHLMINAFRRHLSCVGWLYTEHHDVINEWNGYVRFDRSPKYDGMDELAGMTMRDFHKDAYVFFAGTHGQETGEIFPKGGIVSIPVGVSLTTGAYAGKALELSVGTWYYDGEGRKVEIEREPVAGTVAAKSWQCEKLWDVSLALPPGPAAGCAVFVLKADGEEIARNFWCFSVKGAGRPLAPTLADWSEGSTNVLDGLKVNGFGEGAFEFVLDAPPSGGVFRVELSAKRRNGKDRPKDDQAHDGHFMLGGGSHDRSRCPNSYPQTSDEKHLSKAWILIDEEVVKELTLPDDPADHRGILSWLNQPHDSRLREAGSYGWLVEAPVPPEAVKDGKVTVRLEADSGLAVYGEAFGRYPFGPHVSPR